MYEHDRYIKKKQMVSVSGATSKFDFKEHKINMKTRKAASSEAYNTTSASNTYTVVEKYYNMT